MLPGSFAQKSLCVQVCCITGAYRDILRERALYCRALLHESAAVSRLALLSRASVPRLFVSFRALLRRLIVKGSVAEVYS